MPQTAVVGTQKRTHEAFFVYSKSRASRAQEARENAKNVSYHAKGACSTMAILIDEEMGSTRRLFFLRGDAVSVREAAVEDAEGGKTTAVRSHDGQ